MTCSFGLSRAYYRQTVGVAPDDLAVSVRHVKHEDRTCSEGTQLFDIVALIILAQEISFPVYRFLNLA